MDKLLTDLAERIKPHLPAIKEHAPKAAIMAPLILVPAFVAIMATVPSKPQTVATELGKWGNSVVIPLPEAKPYVPGEKREVVQGDQVVQVETKVIYVEVPAKNGKPATVEKKVVEVPVKLPEVVLVPEEPKPTELDRIMAEPPPPAVVKPTPRTVQMASVQYDRARMKNFQPPYPDDLRNDGIQGVVKVRVVVGPDGRPRLIRPLAGHPRLFNVVKNHGLKNWRFKPALIDGMPSTGNIDVSITFKLGED